MVEALELAGTDDVQAYCCLAVDSDDLLSQMVVGAEDELQN